MISQGIRREIIQTLVPIILSQMSKGEPIKLSTTLFLFCAQSFISSRNWLSYLIHGDGRVQESNLNFGSHPFLGKRVFTSWERAHKCVISIMHSCSPPPHAFLALLHFSYSRLAVSSCSPWLGSRFGNAQWLGYLPHNQLLFPHFSMHRKSIFVVVV